MSAKWRSFASLVLAALCAWCGDARGATYTVTSTADSASTTGTLRWAVAQANANGTSIISIPPGTYSLTQGELDLGPTVGAGAANNVSIIGTGSAANTIIRQTDGQNRVFNLDPQSHGGATFAFANVTLTGGHDALDGFGGGGIITGNGGAGSPDYLFLTNVVVTGCSTTGDGAGLDADGGSVTMVGCTFSSNSISGGGTMLGGGVFFLPQNTGDTFTALGCFFLRNKITATGAGQQAEGGGVTLDTNQAIGSIGNLTNCVFGANTATSSNGPQGPDFGGGGMYIGAGSTIRLVGCTFTNNAANATLGGASGNGGNGGGVLVQENQSSVLVQYCRFTGNTAAANGGSAIWGSTFGTSHITANDNWWAANTGPAAGAVLNGTVANWLVFTNTAAAATDVAGTGDGVTATWVKDSAGNSIAAVNLMALTNLPVTFSAVDGTLSGVAAVVSAAGAATATFTGTTAGSGSVTATVDGVGIAAAITVTAPPQATGVNSTPSSHAYVAGQTVPLVVTFSTAVTVTGNPHLALSDGGTAVYASGSGTASLTFNYVPAAGDTSAHLDYASATALTLNGGTIMAAGTAVGLTLPAPGAAGSLGANTTLIIDTTLPTAALTATPAAFAATNAATFAYTAADSGSGLANVQYQLDGGALGAATSPLTLTGLADGSHTFKLQATDVAGNVAATNFTWTVDTTLPMVLLTGKPAALSSSPTATFTFTATDSGSGLAATQYQLDGGTWFAATSPVILSGLAAGAHTFTLQATDRAGNSAQVGYPWTVGAAPTITIPPAGQVLGYGSNTTLTVTAAGTAPLAYQWTFNSGAIANATATSYTLSGMTAALAGNYAVVVTNLYGSITSAPAAITYETAVPVMQLSSSISPVGYRSPVTFLAVLPNATGQVVFQSGGTPISTNSLVGGNATSAAWAGLPRGTNLITVVYSGDADYSPLTNTFTQVVTNHPPVAGNGSYTLIPGSSFAINLAGLLTNRVSDVDGDNITLSAVGVSTNGVQPITNATAITYQNARGVNDQFTYTVSDGFGGTAAGLITLLVNPYGAFGPTPPGITFTRTAAQPTFSGLPGYAYQVTRSTNDAAGPWFPVLTTNAPAGGLFQYVEAPPTNHLSLFRLLYPGGPGVGAVPH